jgi:hypothetical protein
MRKMRFAALATVVALAAVALAASSASSPTAASAAPSPPAATTGSASNVGQNNATLSGTVNPNGQATTYYFRYGTTTAYGLQSSPANAGSGTSSVGVHTTIFGLSANTTYHYQLVAKNSTGTAFGSDQMFTTTTTTAGEAVVLGHEGFVSPGRIVGVELGCFHGTTTCTGQLTMTHNGSVIAQRSYSIAPDSGGFQNMELSAFGRQLLNSNGVFHLLPVTVTAAGSSGQKLSFVIHLSRWVWH